MAKRAQAGLKELPAGEAPAEWIEAPPDAAPEQPPEATPLPRWRVALNCPTPLAHTELVVEAAGADEARELFMAANGICGSNHDWTITKVDN